MNWKLIFQLSVFGLIMAFGTITLIPEKAEPIFWLLIFGFCAFVIAKACYSKYFLHGFLVCLVNCVWIIIAHMLFRHAYLAAHPSVRDMNTNMPLSIAVHPRIIMLIVGAVSGVLFGIILGLFAFVASRIVKDNAKL